MNKVIKWEDVSYIISSNYRKSILQNLTNPTMPSKLSRELNINKTHISRGLNELEKKKMIECLTPRVTKGKLYMITDYGKEILKEVSKL